MGEFIKRFRFREERKKQECIVITVVSFPLISLYIFLIIGFAH